MKIITFELLLLLDSVNFELFSDFKPDSIL